jgi:hypothetical protein
VSDDEHEPTAKRQKIEPSHDKYAASLVASKFLQKKGVLAIGLKTTLKLINAFLISKDSQLAVFVVHDKEHQESSAQVMAACR